MPTMLNQRLEVKVALLEEREKNLEERLERLEKEAKDVREMANRWKGGAAVLIVLGSFIGLIISQVDHIKTLLGVVK